MSAPRGTTKKEQFLLNIKDNLIAPKHDGNNLLYSSDDSDNSMMGDAIVKHESDSQIATATGGQPIAYTRCNKTFLMRMEQNKQNATSSTSLNKGVVACPNTPELPRRANHLRSSFRTSVPRDSSLSRMKHDLPNLQTAKKILTQSASNSKPDASTSNSKQRVLPKYMDISKYKPAQGQHFLKRDESKSTLINRNEIRKSPSAIGLSKAEPLRASGRVKSAGAKLPSTPVVSAKGKRIALFLEIFFLKH